MKLNNDRYYASQNEASAGYNEGLRKYLLSVYNYMGLALLVTGLIAMFASQSESFMQSLINHSTGGFTLFGWIVMLAPLGLSFFLSARIEHLKLQTVQLVFWAYSVCMGLSLSFIFALYTGESIAKIFFITASLFGGMSLYGYTTKKDLSNFGSFLIMGLFGIIIASLVNMFLKSSALMLFTSIISTLIFTGMVAFETQNLKRIYFILSSNSESQAKSAITGALSLYLNFINIFLNLLRLFGDRREN